MNDWKLENMKKYADQMFGDEFFNSFRGVLRNNGPDVNIYDSGNELFCLISLPGLQSLEKVEIYINFNQIHLSGSTNINYKGFQVLQNEIFQGNFERKIELPYPVREDQVDATYQKGILQIHLHRLLTAPETKNKLHIKEIED